MENLKAKLPSRNVKRAASGNSARRYVLEVSGAQVKLISTAVEFYARLGTGQFIHLDRFFWKDIEKARPHLESLHILRNGSLNCFGSIRSGSIDDDYRVLYDLHQVIRHRLALDKNLRPEKQLSVDYNTPWRSSKKEPLARISQTPGQKKS